MATKLTTLRLRDVLKIHEAFAHHTPLKNNLCDGYLYSEHSVFRNVRDCAVALGVQYTTDDAYMYSNFWTFSLPELVKGKRVPYADNVTKLLEIEAKRPGRFDFTEVFPRTNHLYHESGHILFNAVVDTSIFKKIEGIDGERQELLRTSIEESMANTMDLLGTSYCNNDLFKQIYHFTTDFSPHALKEAQDRVIDIIDLDGAFSFGVMMRLAAAFLFKKLDAGTVSRILTLLFPKIRFTAKEKATFCYFADRAIQLDPIGLITVSDVYFRYMFDGNRNIFELCDFDFIKVLEENPEIVKSFQTFADIARYGTGAKCMLRILQPKSDIKAA